jgi:hypothetical protein
VNIVKVHSFFSDSCGSWIAPVRFVWVSDMGAATDDLAFDLEAVVPEPSDLPETVPELRHDLLSPG